ACLARTLPTDRPAAGDRVNLTLYDLDPTKPSGSPPLATAKIAAAPVAMVASPGGHFVYLDESNDDLEVIDVGRLLQGLPVTPPPLFPVGPKTKGVLVTATGQRLYVPYTGNLPGGSDGGVAILDISDTDCGAPLHEVRACP